MSSPSSSSWRQEYLLVFAPQPRLPSQPSLRRSSSVELPASLAMLLSEAVDGGHILLEVDPGTPRFLAEAIASSLESVVSASAYGDKERRGFEDGGLLVVSERERNVAVSVVCPLCGDKKPLADHRAVLTTIAGVPVFFFYQPWSPAYFVVSKDEGRKASMVEFN